MKSRGLIVFGGLVAIVVSLAIWDYWSEEKESEHKEKQSVIFGQSLSSIESVQFKEGESIFTLQKKDNTWEVISSFKDQANSGTVTDLLESMLAERTKEKVDGEIDPKTFGLDQPRGEIVIRWAQQGSTEIKVGSRKSFQGDSYIQISDKEGVFVASPMWFDFVNKKPSDLRDLRLFRGNLAAVDRFQTQEEKKIRTYVKKEAHWISKENPEIPLDQNKVRDFLFKFQSVSAIEVLSEGKPGVDQVRNLGLNKPIWRFEFFEGEKEVFNGAFYQGSGQVTSLKGSETDLLLKVSPSDHLDIKNLVKEQFFKRNFQNELNPSEISHIRFFDREKSYQIKKEASWILQGESEFQAQSDIIEQSLKRISDFEFDSFESPKKTLPPKFFQKIEFYNSNNQNLLTLTFYDNEKFVSSRSNFIFTANSEAIDKLNLNLWVIKPKKE